MLKATTTGVNPTNKISDVSSCEFVETPIFDLLTPKTAKICGLINKLAL